jgi:NADH dehydrogenase FAD-containing subunit
MIYLETECCQTSNFCSRLNLTKILIFPSSSLNYQYEDHAILSLRSWVNIVYGKMTMIDRRKKQIVINSQKVLPYDHLILSTGLQYYKVAPMDADVYNFHTKQEVKPTFDRILFGN